MTWMNWLPSVLSNTMYKSIENNCSYFINKGQSNIDLIMIFLLLHHFPFCKLMKINNFELQLCNDCADHKSCRVSSWHRWTQLLDCVKGNSQPTITVLGAEMLLPRNMSRVTSSVINMLCSHCFFSPTVCNLYQPKYSEICVNTLESVISSRISSIPVVSFSEHLAFVFHLLVILIESNKLPPFGTLFCFFNIFDDFSSTCVKSVSYDTFTPTGWFKQIRLIRTLVLNWAHTFASVGLTLS